MAGGAKNLVNGVDSIDVGSPEWVTRSLGPALAMPGASGIRMPNTDMGNAGPISIAIAFRFNGLTGGFPRLIWLDGAPSPFSGFMGTSNTIYFSVDASSTLSGPTLTVGREYLFVFTHPGGTGLKRIYQDGRLTHSQSGIAQNYGSGELRVGYRDDTRHVSVDVSDLRAWRRQLTDQDVAELFADPWAAYTPRSRSYFAFFAGGAPPDPPTAPRRRQKPQLIGCGVI